MTKIKCSVVQVQENRTPNVRSLITHLKPITDDDPTKAKLAVKFVETDERTLKHLLGHDLSLTDIIEVSFKVTNEQLTLEEIKENSEEFEEGE